MAITMFSKAAGLVSAFPDPTIPIKASLRMEGWGGFDEFKAIVTRVTVSSQGNYQFLHTLGGDVFIYVFGDRVGQLSVSGLAFDSTCDDPAGSIGVERVFSYYNSNRVAARKTPIKVTIGLATTVKAYLIGLGADVADPKSRIWQYNMQLALIPEPLREEEFDPNSSESGTHEEDSGSEDSYSGGDFPTASSSGVDTGGAVTGSAVSTPVAGGFGYAAYGTGPATILTRGFS